MLNEAQWRLAVRITYAMILLCAAALSLQVLREPDVWWQLKTGDWMLENGQISRFDPFSFTMQGEEWLNVKWLSEIIMSYFARLGGPEFSPVLQAIVICSTLYFLWRACKWHGASQLASIVILIFALAGMSFRINGRPEMFSLLLTAAFILIFVKYREKPSNQIFLLIPLQAIWANLHEGYGTGMVMILIFLFASWAEQYLFVKKEAGYLKPLTIAGVLALFAVSIHPYGYQMILHPLEILGQVYENKYTTELFGFRNPLYWTESAYISLAFLSLILIFWLQHAWQSKGRFLTFLKQWLSFVQLPYILLVVAFFYLSLTAQRNIPFFLIVAAPGSAVALSRLIRPFHPKHTHQKLSQLILFGFTTIILLWYVSITTGQFYEWTDSKKSYGLQVSGMDNPVAAASFIRDNNIRGRAFTDYVTSSYLLWELYPEFKSFIDLRDLDIYPATFFQQYLDMINEPGKFRAYHDTAQFNYIVLQRARYQNLHKHLTLSSDFYLVYVDPVAAIYVDSTNLKNLTYWEINSDNVFQFVDHPKPGKLSKWVNKFFWPLYKHLPKDTLLQHLAAAEFHNYIADPNVAVNRASIVADETSPFKHEALRLLGDIVYTSAVNQPDKDRQQKFLRLAVENYKNSIKGKPSAAAYLGLGNCMRQLGQLKAAEKQYEKAIKQSPRDLNIYLSIVELYRQMENKYSAQQLSYIDKKIKILKRAERLEPYNDYVLASLGFEYCKKNMCKESIHYLNKTDFDRLSQEDRDARQICLGRCR